MTEAGQNVDPVTIQIFRNLFQSVAEEMGVALVRTSYSPNIKERRDSSCAVFDGSGRLVAQAAHIPVHLGAMPFSVRAAIQRYTLEPGDAVILNDPFLGGTHLPDITIVSPVYISDEPGAKPFGYVASRAHHADVGGMTPGSIPMSTELYQEGIIIPPVKLVERGVIHEGILELICRNSRMPDERRGDLSAQLAAHRVGEARLVDIVRKYGPEETGFYLGALIDYAERLTRASVAKIPDGVYEFVDHMDDDGNGDEPVRIQVRITVRGDEVEVDFTGTSPQRPGPVNAVLAVTTSATLYVMRCLGDERVPANHGCLIPVKIVAPPGTVVNALSPAAVNGGNTETSQRITDVLIGAFGQALPDLMPAAGQGTMNNVAFGGIDPFRNQQYAYYETIGGGMGGSPTSDGLTGVHVHMSNTLNTPVEALEFAFPLRVEEYSIRRGTGGAGRHKGGDGLRRSLRFLAPTSLTILSERRRFPPYGARGGSPGQPGRNTVRRTGQAPEALRSKVTIALNEGDTIVIESPGGGGWGEPT
ncbi:MAG: hydantoinase B/oxoprolinase family protein [Chloroflexi bacterium]|nr:hydantoinase B/oxoprolinase family protein [Chloroflexota bacterium]